MGWLRFLSRGRKPPEVPEVADRVYPIIEDEAPANETPVEEPMKVSRVVFEIGDDLKVTPSAEYTEGLVETLVQEGYLDNPTSKHPEAINAALLLVAAEAADQIIEAINAQGT